MDVQQLGDSTDNSNSFESPIEKIWNLKWSNFFPVLVDDIGISCHQVTQTEASHFLEANYSRIHHLNEPQPFLADEPSKGRFHYHEANSVFFAARNSLGVVVGIFIVGLVDWRTAYLRSASLLDSYQGLGIFQFFVSRLIRIFRDTEVKFLEVDVSPGNLAQIHLFNKLEFNVVGGFSTTRFGSLVRLCHFLDKRHLQFFLEKNCAGVRPQYLSNFKGGDQ